jgi:hypothetical protein
MYATTALDLPNIMVCTVCYHNHMRLGSCDQVSAIQEPRDRLARGPENRAPLLLSQHPTHTALRCRSVSTLAHAAFRCQNSIYTGPK